MNYLRGALNAASQYYRDINPSTLTGAIDVIVVRRVSPSSDGSTGSGTDALEEELACSPFHVRFGKWQVLRPVDKKVKVLVNGREIPFGMKIGDAGEAFFVFETDDDVPEELITSPILEATRPGESSARVHHVEAGRFAAREDGEGEGRGEEMSEPEPFDLDSPSNGANKSTPRSSTLSLSDPSSRSTPDSPSPSSSKLDDDHEENDTTPIKPSGILERTAVLGKAVVNAAVEADREERQRVKDRADAARNAAARAYQGLGNLRKGGGGVPGDGENEKGDEVLPPVKDGEGEPPTVVYSHDMVLDTAGYHSKDGPEDTMKETKNRVPGQNSPWSEETDDYDSYEGPSTPRSGDISAQATPTQSPDTSRSPSLYGRYSDVSKRHKSRTLPTLRATSEPPDLEGAPEGSPPPAYSWEWGAFPQPSPMNATFSPSRGDSLESHRSLSVPPELDLDASVSRPGSPARAKMPESYSAPPVSPTRFFGDGAELSADEKNGRRFLLMLGGRTYEFELSISEELAEVEGGGSNDEILDARHFREGQVSFRRFIKFPGVVHDKDLVIKWNNSYITRRDGSPLMECLVKWREAALAKPANSRALDEEEEPLSSSDEQEPEPGLELATPKKTSSSWVRWWRSSRTEPEPQPQPKSKSKADDGTPRASRGSRDGGSGRERMEVQRPGLAPSSSAPPDSDGRSSTPVPFPTLSASRLAIGEAASDSGSEGGRKRFAKTLRLTSDQLKQLDLKPGLNSITFSLSASGTTACTASIFLWESTDSVVVSDIDGTITKSDALGHVFTMIGRDWTHIGVAKLYTDICRNGYKIMYLTSRAIGQADSTRYYLKGIKQNNYQLPEGPVIMSPDRLMASFHREVIMRKPEVFKMACLRDIQRLFGEGKNPFYAGFGNRITDALSYRSVNIPSQRIFTIDSTGEVKMELLEVAGYKSSYIHLTDLVDQMFPPIHQKSETEFSDYNFWKTPVQEFPLPDLSPPSPALSARSDVSGQTASTSTFSRLRNFSLRQTTLPLLPLTQQDARGTRSQATSPDRLGSRYTRSTETLAEDARGDDKRGRGHERSQSQAIPETSRERRARKRMSLDSMPGSLSGSQADFEIEEEDEEEEECVDEEEGGGGEEDYGEDGEDPEEAAEDGFDDDLLATGEMESVPFL